MMKNAYALILAAILFVSANRPVLANDVTVSTATELQNAIQSAQGGDSILLLSGNYGDLTVSGRNPAATVFIRAATGATPVFTHLRVQNSSNWTIVDVEVRPRYSSGADGTNAVVLDGDHLALEDSRINYADDVSSWTAADWLARAGNGISMEGTAVTVRNNTINAVDHGINSSTTDSLVSGNVIANFRGDGIRGLGDRMVYEYNTIKNSYAVDDNHDDGFQSWSYGTGGVGTGVVRDVTLRGNTIINFEDPNQPYRSTLQGIGLFDGMFEGWIVENNLVITDHWHGISFYGAINCRIINNTVVDNDAAPSPDPWIMVNNHKNGTASSGVIVRNNIATDYSLTGGVTTDHNLEITMANAAAYFVNPAGGNGDYHLRATSPAIDAGSGSGAPARDKDGALRPQGITWDIGAYESAPLLALQGALADHAIHLSWTTNTPLSPSATWRITYTGPAGDQASPISGLPEPTRAYVVTGLTNYVPYTVTLNAVLDGTAVLTDTMTVMPTDRWISIPMISR